MPRSTTADLRARLRLLISDPAGADQQFTEDQLEAALDQNQAEVAYLPLDLVEVRLPGGALDERKFRALCGDWEADATTVDGNYNPVTGATIDYTFGVWAFATPQTQPLYLSGKAFNLHAAAVRLLRQWAAALKLEHDLGTGGKNLSFSQQFTMVQALAVTYEAEAKRWPGLGLPAINPAQGAIGVGQFDDSDQWSEFDRFYAGGFSGWRF